MTYLNLAQFRATKREVADLAAEGIETGVDDPQAGFVYDNYCYIDKLPEGGFHLLIETSEWLDDDLAKLERILWALHYMFEQQGALLSADDSTLDEFIVGVCEAHDKPVDGDYFGHAFSDVTKVGWPVVEAYEVVHGAFASELYAQEG